MLKKTFITFLADKGISGEVFEARTEQEQKALRVEFESAREVEIKALKESGVSKEALEQAIKDSNVEYNRTIKGLEDAMSEQGVEMAKLVKALNGNVELNETQETKIHKWIEDNHTKIEELRKNGHGNIEIELKDLTTQSASLPVAAPNLVGIQQTGVTDVNLRGSIVEPLLTSFATNIAAYPYTEMLPAAGDFGFVLEKGLKPEVDFTLETRYAEPKKVAGHIILSEESVTDIKGLQSLATGYLRKKHDLKKEDGILFGDNTGANPEGITTVGTPFVAGDMATSVNNPNIMDVIGALVTDIYTTSNYEDELEYMPSLVLLNPVDFFLQIVSAKDGEGRQLFPTASLFNRVMIGGTMVIPTNKMPAGDIFCGDMSKVWMSNYVPYSVRIGWIDDQFITNQFTMVGESRFHLIIKELSKVAFRYDAIETIETAIAV